MLSNASLLLTLGGILLFGLLISAIGQRTSMPRVTLLMLFGVLIGKDALDIIPAGFHQWFDIIANITLIMVGFLLGGKLCCGFIKESFNISLLISISAALLTTCIVILLLVSLGIPKELAVLLGCIAAATAPAAILDVVNESPHQGPFSRLLLSIVALDDAWALILFALGVAIVSSWNGHAETSILLHAVRDIGGAILLGLALGLPSAYLTGRLKPGQPMLSEALGLVFICGGLAIWLNVSFLITSMVMGATISNLARHHEYPFHEIEGIESQFMLIFFILAGASLNLASLPEISFIGVVYIIARIIGKIAGASLGGHLGKADQTTRNWMGVALLPQAGVAIGMALVASSYFPEHRQVLLSIVISSTIFFEIIGPVFTKLALYRVSLNNQN